MKNSLEELTHANVRRIKLLMSVQPASLLQASRLRFSLLFCPFRELLVPAELDLSEGLVLPFNNACLVEATLGQRPFLKRYFENTPQPIHERQPMKNRKSGQTKQQ